MSVFTNTNLQQYKNKVYKEQETGMFFQRDLIEYWKEYFGRYESSFNAYDYSSRDERSIAFEDIRNE